MSETLVIGYGSTLHSDDAVGVRLAARLTAVCDPTVTVLARHQLLPELAEPISRAQRVIFVDAAAPSDDTTAGQVSVRPVTPEALTGALVHHVRPESLLGLAALLYGHAPPAHLVTISVQSLVLGGDLSPQVAAALPEAVARVRALAAAT
jgi:hydrogenase maturation protease